MERRVLIAVLLSFLVLYGYQALFPSPDTAQKPPQSSKTATAPNAAAPAVANPTPSVQPAQAEAVEGVPAREVAVDNAAVHAVFTTRGGVLKSWELKKFLDSERRPFEMIAGHAPAGSPLPFTLAVDDPALSAKLAAAPFTVTTDGGSGAAWKARFDYDAG